MTSRTLTFVGWGILGAAVVVIVLAGARSSRVPTVGAMLRWIRARQATRLVALAAWLWVGWHVFVRSSRGAG